MVGLAVKWRACLEVDIKTDITMNEVWQITNRFLYTKISMNIQPIRITDRLITCIYSEFLR